MGEAPSATARAGRSGSRTVVHCPARVPSCSGSHFHLSQPFFPSAGPSEVAMKSLMLPVPALWVGCCPGGALAKQGPSLREPMATPTPVGPLTPQPPLPSWPGPPRGE